MHLSHFCTSARAASAVKPSLATKTTCTSLLSAQICGDEKGGQLNVRGLSGRSLEAFQAWVLARTAPRTAERHTVAVSSGLIAGESLMGVAIILTTEILKVIASASR